MNEELFPLEEKIGIWKKAFLKFCTKASRTVSEIQSFVESCASHPFFKLLIQYKTSVTIFSLFTS